MYNEISVMIGANKHKVYLQNGFYHAVPSIRIHKHNYTELHIISGGKASFMIGEQSYTVGDGDIVVIPPKTYHYHNREDSISCYSAFQIDYDIERLTICKLDPTIVANFFRELKEAQESGNHTVISSYIALICSHLENVPREEPRPIIDYGFSIHEFFSQNYNKDVHLRDLAADLYLSERQAERLVVEHTGRTFREELAFTRVGIAAMMISTFGMSLGKAAEYVGYRSYAGFWKAMKKYGEEVGVLCEMKDPEEAIGIVSESEE